MKNHSLSSSLAAFLLGAVLIALNLAAIEITPATAQTRSVTPAPAAIAPALICFANNGQTACVERPALSSASTISDEVRSLTQWLITGPTSSEQAAGIQSALPVGAQLGQVHATERQAAIGLILPDDFLRTLTADQVENINEEFHTTFVPFNFQRLEVNARGSTGDYRLLSDFLPKIELPRKPHLPTPSPESGEGEQPSHSSDLAGGGLSYKTIFVSAGHGWQWNSTFGTYKTQRPTYPSAPYPTGEGIIEDFNNAETVNQYLLPYLQNAGADVWTVRERDMNTQMLIVDDLDSGFTAAGNWISNTGGYNGAYRSVPTMNAAPNATATWTFTPSVTNTYAVYVRFPSVAITRTVDARFFVDHAGAVTPVTITQARDGNNWRYIGHYPFYGGRPARIWLTNQSATPGVTVLADAVRIGGGMADTPAPNTSIISGKPRWEEQSWTYAKWVGLPNVNSANDVIVRPIYSEWEREAGEDAIYLSWHTNGYNGYNTTTRGTSSYVYLTPTQNSTLLQSSIHSQLLSEIHSGWDNAWPDRGQGRLDLGEVRLLSTMPGVLIENGFHDNPTDVEAMKDPRFLQLSARAVYHGLVRYWNAIDPNVPLMFLPEPPQQVTMRNSGPGQITIGWLPGPIDGSGPLGDVAASYRVYTSTDGFGWSNPIEAATTAYTLTALAPNQLIFAKVTGVNAGGESLASPVLAARTALGGSAHLLVVYGFDRIDRLGDTQQNDPPEGFSRRVFIDRINRFDAIIQHAEVITLPFDSAQQAVVSQGSIGLSRYTIVDWIAGENQMPFPTLTASDQSALTSFLNNGGALFISGSEIGYELKNTPFYANTLRASYVADDAQTYAAGTTAGGVFNGLGSINFDDGSHGMYDVNYPDVFAPVNGASSSLVYNTASAAVQHANGCTRLVYSGIPFETIYPRATRQALMTRLIGFLGVCLPPDQVSTIRLPLILNNYQAPEPPPEPVCSDIVVNGGFESGDFAPGWSRLSPNPLPQVVTSPVASGSYAAQIGATTISDTITQTSYSSVEQALTIPANALTATLSFARYRWSGDVISDTQYMVIVDQDDQAHYLISERVHDPTWVTADFDVQTYAGQSIKLWFGVVNKGDNNGTTGMAIDDVQAHICMPQ